MPTGNLPIYKHFHSPSVGVVAQKSSIHVIIMHESQLFRLSEGISRGGIDLA
jgi:hypothetical protein